MYFSSTWVVPEPPDSNDGQEIYLFNGLQQTTVVLILQPVLQWGVTPDGGGAYWAIANWYVPAPSLGLPSMKSSLIQVNPGDVLQGVMTCTSQTGSEFSYVSSFVGYPSIDLTVTDVDELQWSFETLECYGLTQCSDYPASALTAFYDVEVRTESPGASGTDATIDWQAQTNFTDCGQNCIVVSDDSPGGAATCITTSRPRTSTSSTTRAASARMRLPMPSPIAAGFSQPLSTWPSMVSPCSS